MPFVSIPKDLSAVKNKVFMSLTSRQLICFASGAAIGAPAYFLTRPVIGNSNALLLMIGLMLPAFFVAMYEKDGQPAEKILRNVIRARFLWPGIRVYKTKNLYEALQIKERGEPIAAIQTKQKPQSKVKGQ